MLENRLLAHISGCLLVLVAMSSAGFCQSAGTDTLEKGRSYYEANFWTATQSHFNGGQQIYGGRVSYGLTNRIEIGVGASFSNPNDPEFPPEFQPSFKYKFYENEKHGVTIAGGAIAYIPFARRADTDTFVMTYGNLSKEVKKMNGARFTAGGYTLLGRSRDFGTRSGMNFMYEQPISEKVSFSTQWVTGKNRFGYVTPGLSFAVTKKSSLFLGYSIGNYDYDNHGPYASYGVYR